MDRDNDGRACELGFDNQHALALSHEPLAEVPAGVDTLQ